jgi:hypothetical protein
MTAIPESRFDTRALPAGIALETWRERISAVFDARVHKARAPATTSRPRCKCPFRFETDGGRGGCSRATPGVGARCDRRILAPDVETMALPVKSRPALSDLLCDATER